MAATGRFGGACEGITLGAPIGLLMTLGSICYVLALSKLDVGTAAAISTSYVVLAALLSWIFLHESLNWMKIIGILNAIKAKPNQGYAAGQ